MNPHDNPHESRIGDMTNDERQAQLTAYALGELDTDDEAAVAAWVAADDEARALVEDVRATAELLSEGFAAEAPEALGSDAREEVVAATKDAPVAIGAPGGRLRSLWPRGGCSRGIEGASRVRRGDARAGEFGSQPAGVGAGRAARAGPGRRLAFCGKP
jgi:anti-sigma factor RsiW